MPQDFKLPQATKHEQQIYNMIFSMRQEFEERMLNVVSQIRAVCIANNIPAEEFIKAFHDEKLQADFFKAQHEAETKSLEAAKKLQEELKAKDEKLKETLSGVAKETETLIKEVQKEEQAAPSIITK